MANRSFRILILKESGVDVEIQDDLQEWQRYERMKIGFDLEFEIRPITVEKILHKPFGITGKESGKQVELYGLDGIKEIVRPLVSEGMYDFVIFLYDIKDSELYKNSKTRALADRVRHWCYFDPLYPGTPFSEIMTKKGWKDLDTFRVMSHEIRHGLCNRLRALGHPTYDVMDATYASPGQLIEYWNEHDPWAEEGNRSRQNLLLKPYLDILAARPEVRSFIERLKRLAASLQAQLDAMTKTKDSPLMILWAEAIKKHEGWYVGSRSYRNFNPGNLKLTSYTRSLGALAKGDDKGFAIFPTYDAGWEALLQFLRDAKSNQLYAYRNYAHARGRAIPSLNDFFQVYAPQSENDTNRYAEVVAAYIGHGITPNTLITSI